MMASASAYPGRFLEYVAFATCIKLAFFEIPCVLAMCLKKIKSKGVRTTAIARLEQNAAISTLTFCRFFPPYEFSRV